MTNNPLNLTPRPHGDEPLPAVMHLVDGTSRVTAEQYPQDGSHPYVSVTALAKSLSAYGLTIHDLHMGDE